ncbi:hypothetical protein MT414_13970 [Mammaliicoccus sciuri]|uniref:hypothetical protein n=1 Tax=Mammaliicoccus sciuri TaxID=1296 RepID=UPI001FB54D30|nr:hypothetical protein [Mammaliicoccus sciuri]MCJ1763121.1 hypothetical protein [Mammaliicoccus sciuri]
MPTIKYTREDITKLVNELDQYKTAHDKLTAGLKEAVSESIKYKRERDTLIKDVEKLREEKAAIEMYLDAVKVYKPMYEKLNKKYSRLTEHIRDKANNNPGNSTYIALVHFIDDLEAD